MRNDSRYDLIAIVPIFSWAVTQTINWFDGSFKGRPALTAFVIAAAISLLLYASIRAVANYRRSIRR